MLAFSTIAEAVEAEGATDALRAVYEAHYDFVWRSVRRLGAHADAADDAVHDVFLVVARRLSEFEGRSQLRTWLFAIAVRVVQRQRRDTARHLRRVEAVSEADAQRTDPGGFAQAEASDTLHRLLEGLSEEKRIAFILSELEGMTAKEIGRAFGVKEATVYTRIRAARKELSAAAARLEKEVAP